MVQLRHVALALLLMLTACVSNDAGGRPLPIEGPPVEFVETPVEPEVEAFFRELRSGAGNRLIAGDRVQIKVEGVDFTIAELERQIPLDGSIPLPKTEGTINALGKTPQQLEHAVAAAYGANYENPYVTVTVAETAPRFVYVSGEVRMPQRYDVGGTPLTLMQVITLAGGPTPEASMARVRVQRFYPPAGREVSSPALDLDSAMASGDQSDNLLIAPGDTVVVPKAVQRKVHMLGHVEAPGGLAWYEGLTLSKAITESGGFKKFAKRVDITVIRLDGTRIEFNFDDFIEGTIPDLELQPGDRVFVPEKWI